MTQTYTDLALETGLPCAPEAERYVLASALQGRSIENLTASLSSIDFHLEKHRRIFAVIAELATQGTAIDRVMVAHELRKRAQLESVDGLTYLVSLDEGMPELVNLDAYVALIREKSTLRKAILAHQKGIEECLLSADPTPEILERAERTLASLGDRTRQSSFRTPLDVINGAGGVQEMIYPKKGGLATPWPTLNRMLVGRGFVPGQMIVIGARPSMGKTALACQIAEHAAASRMGVAFFTLEMSAESILMRMAAAKAQVDGLKVTQGFANEYERQQLSEAFADLAAEHENCPLWIDDTTGCTVPAMRSALRKLTARHSVGLVVIDYLQLVETTASDGRRYEQVSEISRGVKRLAREFGLPVVVLAQLNRDVDKESRKPRMSDLRDSGAIEQDADVVLMPTRQDEHSDELYVDLIIAKQRNGPLGKVTLKFLKRFAKFIEATPSAFGNGAHV